MKTRFQKSLSLLLAVILAFGAMPIIGGMMAFAAKSLLSISISNCDDDGVLTGEHCVDDTMNLTATAVFYESDTGAFTPKSLTEGVMWASSDTDYVTIETGENGAAKVTFKKVYDAAAPGAKKLTISAVYDFGGEIKTAICAIKKIDAAKIHVNKVYWEKDKVVTDLFENNSDCMGEQVYSFELLKQYVVEPANATDPSVTLTCAPAGALTIDNEKQCFTVNKVTEQGATVTLTLTSKDNASATDTITCKVWDPDTINISSVAWTYLDNGYGTLFTYFDKSSAYKDVAEYYYAGAKCEATSGYKYEVKPATIQSVCKIEVTSDNKRVIAVDEETNRLIPLGNGVANVKILATAPNGTTAAKTIVVNVGKNSEGKGASPYTPITEIKSFNYDAKKSSSDGIDYDSASKTLTLNYNRYISLYPVLNDGAKIDHDEIKVDMHDTRGVVRKINKAEATWSSSDESIAVVDQDGKVTAKGNGTATIMMTIVDNGVEIKAEQKINCKMNALEALAAFFMSLFTGQFSRAFGYLGAVFSGLFGSIGGIFSSLVGSIGKAA